MGGERVQEQWIAECVALVIMRLQQRQQAELVLSQRALEAAWPQDAALRHATLRVTHITPAFLRQLGDAGASTPTLDRLWQAWCEGMRVILEIECSCFGLLPIAELRRLPLEFCSVDRQPVHLLARAVAGYADIRPLVGGYLVLARRVCLTALARDEIIQRRLQLYRQE